MAIIGIDLGTSNSAAAPYEQLRTIAKNAGP